MKIFQDSVSAGMYVMGAVFMPKEETYEGNIGELGRLLGKAKKEITIVAGELENAIYEDWTVISEIEKALKKQAKLRILVGPQDWNCFMKEHKRLLNLTDKYKGKIAIYTAEESPKLHFAVVDNKHVGYEKEHKPGQLRDVYYEYGNKDFARKLNSVVDELIKNAA